jgi:DNA primase
VTKEEVLHFLGGLGVKAQPSPRRGWITAHCPLTWRHGGGVDHHPSFGMEVVANKPSRTNCFSCGFHGDAGDLLIELSGKLPAVQLAAAWAFLSEVADKFDTAVPVGTPGFDDYLSGGDDPDPEGFPEWWLDSFQLAAASVVAIKYLVGRGVAPQAWGAFGVRYDAHRMRVCVPVRDFEGKLRGLHGRTVVPGAEPKYLVYTHQGRSHPQVWLGEHAATPGVPLVVGESMFDLFSIYRVYRNVVSPLTSNITKERVMRLSGFPVLIHMFDDDEPGHGASAKLKAWLPGAAHIVADVFPYKDPGEMGASAVMASLEDLVEFDPILPG